MFPPLHRPGTLIFLLPFFIFEFRNIFNLPFICHPVTSIVLEEELPSSSPSPLSPPLPFLLSPSYSLCSFASPFSHCPKVPPGLLLPLTSSVPASYLCFRFPFISPSASVLPELDAIPLPPPAPFFTWSATSQPASARLASSASCDTFLARHPDTLRLPPVSVRLSSPSFCSPFIRFPPSPCPFPPFMLALQFSRAIISLSYSLVFTMNIVPSVYDTEQSEQFLPPIIYC